MRLSKQWNDYECLDIGDGYKVERFGPYILKRPEPSAKGHLTIKNIDFNGVHTGKEWKTHNLPESWILEYKDMKFNLRLHEFKHLGIFPEQATNWDFIREVSKKHNEPLRILNLFGYTGGATIAAAMGNIEEIVHIDALKSAIDRTRENIDLNNLQDKKIRTIQEDVMKFLFREKKRGRTYHGIIMDPPSFGRGPRGDVWKIEEHLEPLIDACLDILDEEAVYIILNTYTTKLSAKWVGDLFSSKLKDRNIKGFIDSQDIGVPVTHKKYPLKLGKTTRWCRYENTL